MQRVLLRGLLRLAALLPLPLAHAIGAGIGWLLWRIPYNSPRSVAERNLAACFPEYSAGERDCWLRRNLMETGKGFLELGALWRWPRARVLALVQGAVAGEEALTAAVQRKQGAILLTPHLGAWEMAGLYYSSRHPLTILYRPSRVGLDEISREGRGRFGGQVVATDPSGVRALLTALHAGKVLGILPDHDPGDERGMFAPFFGRAASTMTLVSRLAMKTGVPVFLTWAERLPHGQGYVLHLQELPDVTAAASLEASVMALNQGVETAVRSLPAQYLWAYKRFKTPQCEADRLY